MISKPFVEDIETYAQDIVDTVREPLLMLDTHLRVQSANRAFYETFHVSPKETEGQLIYELGTASGTSLLSGRSSKTSFRRAPSSTTSSSSTLSRTSAAV